MRRIFASSLFCFIALASPAGAARMVFDYVGTCFTGCSAIGGDGAVVTAATLMLDDSVLVPGIVRNVTATSGFAFEVSIGLAQFSIAAAEFTNGLSLVIGSTMRIVELGDRTLQLSALAIPASAGAAIFHETILRVGNPLIGIVGFSNGSWTDRSLAAVSQNPEPTAALLFGIGLVAVAFRLRRAR
jgi:hypothetical protein